MKLISPPEFKYQLQSSAKTGENYSLNAVLSTALESKDFFLNHQILPPGRRASAPHSHEETDEVIFILKGEVWVHEGDKTMLAKQGSCICFHAGTADLHFVENKGDTDAEMLLISKKLDSTDVKF